MLNDLLQILKITRTVCVVLFVQWRYTTLDLVRSRFKLNITTIILFLYPGNMYVRLIVRYWFKRVGTRLYSDYCSAHWPLKIPSQRPVLIGMPHTHIHIRTHAHEYVFLSKCPHLCIRSYIWSHILLVWSFLHHCWLPPYTTPLLPYCHLCPHYFPFSTNFLSSPSPFFHSYSPTSLLSYRLVTVTIWDSVWTQNPL